MELGSGVAIAGIAIPAAAVAITAIRVFSTERSGTKSTNGGGNGNGNRGSILCKEHSGLVACLHAIEENQTRQEKWLGEISGDVKNLLRRK